MGMGWTGKGKREELENSQSDLSYDVNMAFLSWPFYYKFDAMGQYTEKPFIRVTSIRCLQETLTCALHVAVC